MEKLASRKEYLAIVEERRANLKLPPLFEPPKVNAHQQDGSLAEGTLDDLAARIAELDTMGAPIRNNA